jgi:hypothetical protein
VTYPSQPPVPHRPFAIASPLRVHYLSLVQVMRLKMKVHNGTPSLTWTVLADVIDPFMDIPGQMMCSIQLGFIRRGDMPMPLTAGAAAQRQGTVYYDSAVDPDTNAPYVLAGDRLYCIGGPIQGTFEIRSVPQAAVSWAGAHHIETQIWEVAKSLAQGSQSQTPFPGSEGPDA